jgi:hypothetical protein
MTNVPYCQLIEADGTKISDPTISYQQRQLTANQYARVHVKRSLERILALWHRAASASNFQLLTSKILLIRLMAKKLVD